MRQIRSSSGKAVILDTNADHGQNGDNEKPKGITITLLT